MLIDSDQEVNDLKTRLSLQELKQEQLTQELFSLKNILLEREKEYTSFYDFNPSIIFTIDKSYIIQNLNFKAAALLEIERKLLLNTTFLNYITSNSKFIFKEKIKTLCEKKLKQTCEIEIRQKKEKRKDVILECSLIKDNLIQICLVDISSNRYLEHRNFELEQSLILVNNLFQVANDAIAAVDEQFCLKVMNESFSELLGKIINIKLKVGMNLMNVLDDFPELQTKITNACHKAQKESKATVFLESPIQNIEAYYCYEISIHFIKYTNHQKYKLVFRINNLTAFKLEERLQHKQQSEIALSCRTSASGEMALALAHEINQPLTAIATYSQTCLYIINKEYNNKVGEKLLLPLERIAAQAELAGEIIHNMKNFMRKGNFYVEKTNINQLIKDAVSIFHYELLDFKLKIDLNLMDNLPIIMTNKTHIMQIILNLARNSIEALRTVGETNPKLTIETSQSSNYIYVHVRDNGPGIPEKFRNNILGTYFTTKPKGTGIGLGICRTLVEKHGGTLCLQQQKKGAWFTFTLPICSTDHTHLENN